MTTSNGAPVVGASHTGCEPAQTASGSAAGARRPGRPRASSEADIRRVAVALFAERGYRNTSLEQIATAAGISRTTLFAYFPAKRDLVWKELTERSTATLRVDALTQSASAVDVIVGRILDLGRYPAQGRSDLSQRWRIAQEDEELRSYGAAQTAALAESITAATLRHAPEADARLVDHAVHALIAVATRCLQEWSEGAGRDLDLQDYTLEGLRPIAESLRPLLT